MTPTAQIIHGNNLDVLPTLPDASVDSIVTDPPYELGFMGKRWDASGIAYSTQLWGECLRVLKPGGHLLAFGGTRTYHRMTAAIEDAGFEIRDSIHWLYGSGFPKSLDVSKAIDKQRDDRADIYKVTAWVREARDAVGIGNRDIDNAFGFVGMAGHWTSAKSQPAVPTLEQVPTLLDVLGVALDDVPDEIRRLLWELNGRKGQPGENWAKREVVGKKKAVPGVAFTSEGPNVLTITAPATDAARTWEGWGTALKPAHEPIVVARKPLAGTVAANVIEHGTGALNIDGCRVAATHKAKFPAGVVSKSETVFGAGAGRYADRPRTDDPNPSGRWPANLVLTHAADCADECVAGCPVAELDAQSGITKDGVAVRHRGVVGGTIGPPGKKPIGTPDMGFGGYGGASRFFTVTEWDPIADAVPFQYVAKPSRRERNAGLDGLPADQPVFGDDGGTYKGLSNSKNHQANTHPTVKPLALMRWLVRLVTPPGGTVLEPFAGSGTTLAAAILEGFDSLGIEMTADYLPIIEGRIAWAQAEAERPTPKTKPAPAAAQPTSTPTQQTLL